MFSKSIVKEINHDIMELKVIFKDLREVFK
jgi:hypothetical protein